uniref:YTH domain-containing family protein n=1 Tax=Ananas comosus var. bracteatus TaxID=296719 RepID=A0A6V7QH04_ANACO|nr:unnamed protein product [Ananas comosus var. bracteatus]
MDSKDDFSPDVLGENRYGTQVEQGKAVNRQDHARPASSSPGVGYSGKLLLLGAPTPSFADGGYSKSPYSTTGKVGVDIKASTPMKKVSAVLLSISFALSIPNMTQSKHFCVNVLAQPPSVRSTQLHRYSDEIPSLSSHGQCRFVHKNHQYGDEIPSLSRHRQGRNFPKNHRYGDEIPSLSRHGQRQFSPKNDHYGDEIPSLSSHGQGRFSPKNDHYGDEIPSLSSKRQGGHFARNHSCGDEIPSLFSHGQGRYSSKNLQYADEIPSLSKQVQVGYSSRNHHYGDEIPSLSSQGQGRYPSRNNHYGDEIPSLSKQGQVGYSSRNHTMVTRSLHFLAKGKADTLLKTTTMAMRSRHFLNKAKLDILRGITTTVTRSLHFLAKGKANTLLKTTTMAMRSRHFLNKAKLDIFRGITTMVMRSLHFLAKGKADILLNTSRQGRYSSKYLQCGDKIPSLSKQGQVGYSARNNHYCDEIPSLSSQGRGGFSPKNHCYRDEIPSLSNQDVGYFPGNNLSESRPVDQIVNNNDHFNMNEMNNFSTELVRGPRADRSNNSLASSDEKYSMKQSVARDQYNKPDFETKYEQAKFFMIKSFSEDDVQKSIKYNVWASTTYGNKKLDMAFRDAQMVVKEKGTKCPIFLFFSVNTSGQFVGLAEMIGPDIPNRHFHSIKLENNDNQVVTFSRDTQEIGLPQGLKMLEIFKDYPLGTSILDDFDFYEDKQKSLHATSSHHVTYAHQVEFDEDVYEMEFNETINYLEEGFGEMSFSSGHRKHSGPSVY